MQTTTPAWRAYLGGFWTPLAWLLEAAIVLQLVLGQHLEAALVAALLVFNATLGFTQEGRAGTALAALEKRLAPTALALRDGVWSRLDAAQLVPGDAIRLPLGALVPADARLISGSLLVDQSMVTGESVPVDAAEGDTLYSGSLVRRGQAVAVVTATGMKTAFGRTAELVRTARPKSTEQAAVFTVTRNLAIVNSSVALLMILAATVGGWSASALVSLALTALLGTIPVALPAVFTLAAAMGAQRLAARGVLLTRLSAANEAAGIDVLCADKTGTLTRNELAVLDVVPLPGFERGRVLALAALASSEADADPIDAAIHAAAGAEPRTEQLLSFVPFDPATKLAEAAIATAGGATRKVVKGALEAVTAKATGVPPNLTATAERLETQGRRVIAVAVEDDAGLHVAGLVALSDTPRADARGLIAALRGLHVRTVMVTGDAPATAAAIAREVGIPGALHPGEPISEQLDADAFGVFARVVPEEKYALVKALQARGHLVGMCGDGTNDAPALRQAQMGIAVASATDVAKAAAGMVMTEPGLAGLVLAIREGRLGFARLVAYTLNMLVKKIEIVAFLATGLLLTGRAVFTPVLMVLILITNDLLSMSLTTDHAELVTRPCVWRMRRITAAALVLGTCKLAFSTGVLAMGRFRLGLELPQLQTLAFVTFVFGSQAVLYAVREPHRIWSSRPSGWVLASSAADVGIASGLACAGVLMAPLPWLLVALVLGAAFALALMLDLVKTLVLRSDAA